MKNFFPGVKKLLSVKDLAVKIICVLLSVILWAYISSINIGETRFKVPITFINLPETLIKSKVSHKYVTATLSGRKDILKNVNVKSIKAVVDLEQPKIGVDSSYPIEIIKEEIPDNIEIKLSTGKVNLIVERKIYKKVKIKPNIIDKVMDGYMLGKIQINPDSVIINGPESLIKSINFVETNNISLGNSTGRIVRNVSINKKELQGIDMDISSVKVIIPVLEMTKLFKFKKEILLRNRNDKYEYIISNGEVNVYLQSDNADIKPSEDDFEIFIDLGAEDFDEIFNEGNEEYIEKDYSIEIEIKKEGVKVITLSPDTLSVKIFKK